MKRIAVFVGSLRDGSLNKNLAHNLESLAPSDVVFDYVDISSLPLFNQDLETDYPENAQEVKDIVEAANAVLFVTPEYNRGIPGVLKNAIDWASRPWGTNSFDGKPAGIVGASGGALGTGPAQAQLRSVLVYLNTKLMGQPEIYLAHAKDMFDENGVVIEESKPYLSEYITAFASHIEN